MADRLGVDTIDREGRTVVLKFRPQAKVDPVRLVALVRQRSDLTLVPPAGLKVNLDGIRDSGLGIRRDSKVTNPKSRITKPDRIAPSWCTARARAGEVKPGFSKEEILRPAKEDPRAAGGVFEQVGGLFSDLLDQR